MSFLISTEAYKDSFNCLFYQSLFVISESGVGTLSLTGNIHLEETFFIFFSLISSLVSFIESLRKPLSYIILRSVAISRNKGLWFLKFFIHSSLETSRISAGKSRVRFISTRSEEHT